MKRVALFLVSFLTIAVFFSSCEKETILSIDQTSITVPDTGGSQTITLTANKPWTVSSNQSWCRTSPSAGEEAASTRITITCDANTSYDARSCIVTFTCAEMSGSVNVTQAASNGLLVSQTEYNVSNAAQQLNIEVKANVKFSVEVDNGCKDWVKYNTTKGLTNSTVVLDIAKNDTYDGREGKVTIKQTDGSLSSTVTIKQGQTDGLFLTTSEYNLSNEKHTLTVEVKSNIDFDVKSEVDWIRYVETKGLKTNQIVLEIAANDAYDAREGKVAVKQKNGDLSGTIVVKQEQNYGLIVSKTEYDLSNAAQTIDVEVKYNVDFDVVIPSGCKDWIKQVSTKGLNSRTYTFSIAKNENYDARDGSITFKQINGALSGTVSVKQSQNDGLFVTKSDYEITNENQTINVEVKANIDFEVKSEVDWVKVVETKGLKTSTITLSIAENDSYDAREGKVSVKQNNGDLNGTINIKQKGKNGIILTQSEYELTNDAQTLNVEVKTTVQFEVKISDSGKDWVSLVSTKALETKNCTFSIKKNESFENRQCTVTFIQKGGEMSSTLTIKQRQTNYIDVSPSEFTLDIDGGSITVSVRSNTDYNTTIEESAKSWITPIEPNGTNNNEFTFNVASCSVDVKRSGKIVFTYEDISKAVIINQQDLTGEGNIRFSDKNLKAKLIKAYDTNHDGQLSYGEASVVTTLKGVFGDDKNYKSFNELQWFVGLTELEDSLFDNWALLTAISLPKNITKVGDYCFAGCSSLTKLEMPSQIQSIGKGCLSGCSSLSTIILPKNIQSLPSYCLNGCTSLSSIEIPDGIIELGANCFQSCTSITEIKIPASIKTIGQYCFNNCLSLNKLTLPSGISIIPSYFINGCKNLKKLEIPTSVSTISSYAFSGCYIEKIIIPSTVISIDGNFLGENPNIKEVVFKANISYIPTYYKSDLRLSVGCFNECEQLEKVIIESPITTLPAYCFKECVSLTTLEIPSTVTHLGLGCFVNCFSLVNFDIPKNVQSIEGGCFYNCRSLKTLTIPSGIVSLPNSEIYFYGYKENYKERWMGNVGFFQGCSSLESISLPTSITSIGNAAFSGCKSLKTLSLPTTLMELGESLFAGCESLETISIPSSVSKIGAGCFSRCFSIKKIVIPSSVSSIGNGCFVGCKSLTDITIPSTITELPDFTFGSCRSLTYFTIPQSIQTIGEGCFADCQSLKKISIPSSVTRIGGACFALCSSLTEVSLPETITELKFGSYQHLTEDESGTAQTWGNGAFGNCSALLSIKIPSNVKVLETLCFSNCSSLKEVQLPDGLEVIGSSVFQNCSSLSSISLNNKLMEIGDSAFTNCTSLTTVTIPESVTLIRWNAFKGCNGLTSVYCLPKTPPTLYNLSESYNPKWEYSKYLPFDTSKQYPIFVPAGSLALYQPESTSSAWYYYKDRIKAIP